MCDYTTQDRPWLEAESIRLATREQDLTVKLQQRMAGLIKLSLRSSKNFFSQLGPLKTMVESEAEPRGTHGTKLVEMLAAEFKGLLALVDKSRAMVMLAHNSCHLVMSERLALAAQLERINAAREVAETHNTAKSQALTLAEERWAWDTTELELLSRIRCLETLHINGVNEARNAKARMNELAGLSIRPKDENERPKSVVRQHEKLKTSTHVEPGIVIRPSEAQKNVLAPKTNGAIPWMKVMGEGQGRPVKSSNTDPSIQQVRSPTCSSSPAHNNLIEVTSEPSEPRPVVAGKLEGSSEAWKELAKDSFNSWANTLFDIKDKLNALQKPSQLANAPPKLIDIEDEGVSSPHQSQPSKLITDAMAVDPADMRAMFSALRATDQDVQAQLDGLPKTSAIICTEVDGDGDGDEHGGPEVVSLTERERWRQENLSLRRACAKLREQLDVYRELSMQCDAGSRHGFGPDVDRIEKTLRLVGLHKDAPYYQYVSGNKLAETFRFDHA